jgi:hypothetical protein
LKKVTTFSIGSSSDLKRNSNEKIRESLGFEFD